MCLRKFFGVFIAAGLAASISAAKEPVFTVGLVDTFSPDFYVNTYSETLDHLSEILNSYDMKVVEIDYRNIQEELKRLKPDFLVSSASDYVALMAGIGAQQIATKRPVSSESVSKTVASLFLVLADSPIRSLADAKGKNVAMTSKNSFDGWLIALGEIAAQNFPIRNFFSQYIETHYAQPDVIAQLFSGKADIAVLAACEFEKMLENGEISRKDFRIINEKSSGAECRRSTERYPDVVFSAMPNVPSDLVKKISVALMTMQDPRGEFEWTVANEFKPTFDLMKALSLPPFEPQPMSIARLWREYRTEIVLAIALLFALLFHIFTVNILVRRRTAELSESLEETKTFYQQVQDGKQKLLSLERMNVVSQLSSMFAHEIKQPITNISYYLGSLKLFLQEKKICDELADMLVDSIDSELNRSTEIIDKVRSYAKKRSGQKEVFDLNDVIVEMLKTQDDGAVYFIPDGVKQVNADPFEVKFIVSNFVKNAFAAAHKSSPSSVTIEAVPDGRYWRVNVADNGPAIPDEVFSNLGKVGQSTKDDGLGFGLAIASGFAESMGGHLEFARLSPHGLQVSLLIPKYLKNERH